MLRLQKITRTFYLGNQALNALNRVDLTVEQGEYISVMGPSGSGKSTLLNVMGLLDQPTSGHYWFNNRDTTQMSDLERAQYRRNKIGFVFQSFHLIDRFNARENIELPMTLAGISPKLRREKANEVLERLGLTARAEHLPNQLSGGERQRVAIGRAVVMKPSALFADEPTGNLDSHVSKEVIDLLEELNGQGITLLIVTHDVSLGERANRQIRIVDGMIEKDIRREILTKED